MNCLEYNLYGNPPPKDVVPAENLVNERGNLKGMQENHSPSSWQRFLQRIAATRPGSWLFSHTLHHIDKTLLKLSGGRFTSAQVLAGLPTVELTTTGARTGKPRTVPVMGMRDGDYWVLVASNWGRDRHPAWYHNLRENPEVELSHNGEKRRYVAREANAEERGEYWRRAKELYVGFEGYRRRSGDRQIPVVVLTPEEE